MTPDEIRAMLPDVGLGEAEYLAAVYRVWKTEQAVETLRRELADSRRTMRKALDLLDCGDIDHARRTLAHVLGLGDGPVYGGGE